MSPPYSPPPSPVYEEFAVILTDNCGMIADDDRSSSLLLPQDVKKESKKREPRRYVSKHFTPVKVSRTRGEAQKERNVEYDTAVRDLKQTPPATPTRRMYNGINVDDLSSDSSLTDVPDDIGPDPFTCEVVAVKSKKSKAKSRKKHPLKSPYFPHAHRYRPTFLSTLPFPPLSDTSFGLMQERLAHDPFRLLIATIFLNKTPGQRAMPIFFQLMARYPTPTALASARVEDITEIIYELGFQNQRARKCVEMAKMWLLRPPSKDSRSRKLNYPCKGDGRDIKQDEIVTNADPRIAWEISHLPGLGPYSHDSWRMFCRDELRGLASSWLGEDANDSEFEPEWKRVVPLDKELRAYLTWMWLKEGWVWNKETGERTPASQELLDMARGGGIVQEERENQHLLVTGLDRKQGAGVEEKVEKPAGQFIPEPPM